MLIKRVKGWEIPERRATPESVFLNRRAFMTGTGAIAAAGVLGVKPLNALSSPIAVSEPTSASEQAPFNDPTADLYPAAKNALYKIERDITEEKINAGYNNFYEFGSHKQIASRAQALQTRPWTVKFDGEVEEEREVDIDTLIRAMGVEERLYRHRCVEAWSMTIPWSGFPLSRLVDYARPLSGAKYLVMETFHDSEVASGQRQFWYPWPYTEGLTMAEATNDLAFLVTGAYGKPAAKQFGAPLRLAAPWKYGFKSIKSIVRFTFSKIRPTSFWTEINAEEYGFWANVNPEVSHPRWSQASERVLGTEDRIPTRIFNGYGEFVADIYKDLKDEMLYR